MSSSRRSGHEDSILAKLEREPARRAGGRTGMRLVWYGTAALAAVGLTAILALLAADSGTQTVEVAQVSESGPVRIGGAVSQPLQETQSGAQGVPAPVPETTSALIVDAAPDPAPPLRMLDGPDAKPTPVKVAPVIVPPAPVRVAAPVPITKPEPRSEARQEPRREPRSEPRQERRPETRSVARSEARPAPNRARNVAARAPARQGARTTRTINPARSGEHDDSDVALISAVIYHANGHATGDGSDENTSICADESCRPRPARQ
jgi:outer membrane biosynthesis protein TonB